MRSAKYGIVEEVYDFFDVILHLRHTRYVLRRPDGHSYGDTSSALRYGLLPATVREHPGQLLDARRLHDRDIEPLNDIAPLIEAFRTAVHICV